MLDAVLPTFLPLDIFYRVAASGRRQWSRNLFEVFLAHVDGGLVEYFEHVIVKNWEFGV